MHKRGQLFIFAAVLLCTMVLLGVSNTFTIAGAKEDMRLLYENSLEETSYAVNSAIWNHANASAQAENFTSYFEDYARARRMEMKVFLILVYPNNQSYFSNHLEEIAYVTTDEAFLSPVLPSTEKVIKTGSNFTVSVGDESFEFFQPEGSQISVKALFRK